MRVGRFPKNSLGIENLLNCEIRRFMPKFPKDGAIDKEDDEICRILNFTKKVKKDYTQTQ